MVWSVGDVRIVMEVLKCLFHSEISLYKPLHQMLTAVVVNGYCLCAMNQVQAEEDELKYGC